MTKDQAIAILQAERVLQMDMGDLPKPDGPDSIHGSPWYECVKEARCTILDYPALIREFSDIHLCICKRCGTPLNDKDYCTDGTCPYSDYLQHETWTEG